MSRKEWQRKTLLQLLGLADAVEILNKELQCSICLSEYKNARQLSCGHVYCEACVLEMLNRKSKCAICGEAMTKRNIRIPQLNYDSLVENTRIFTEQLSRLSLLANEKPVPATPQRKLRDGFSQSVVPCTTPHRVTTLAKRRKKENLEPTPHRKRHRRYQVRGLPLDVESGNICALCPVINPADGETEDNDDARGPLTAVTDAQFRVHKNCGLWVPEVYEHRNGKSLSNVSLALHFAEGASACSICQKPRALIPCDVKGCDKRYHFRCAISNGAKAVFKTCKMYCPRHKAQALNEEDLFEDMVFDSWKKNAQECYICHEEGYLLCCENCPNVAHTTCEGLIEEPEGSFYCLNCRPDQSNKENVLSKSTENNQHIAGILRCRHPLTKKSKQAKTSKLRTAQEVLLATGLDDAQKDMFVAFAHRRNAQVVDDFRSSVTHVVTSASNPSDTPKRTLKFCAAVASGCRVVSFEWVQTSYEQDDDFLESTSYELPNSGTFRNHLPLFKDAAFYFENYNFRSSRTEKIAEIVRHGGGRLLTRIPKNNAMRFFIVESADAKSTRTGGLINERVKSLSCTQVITEDWILDRCSDPKSNGLSLFESAA